jgi:hypothetical protein
MGVRLSAITACLLFALSAHAAPKFCSTLFERFLSESEFGQHLLSELDGSSLFRAVRSPEVARERNKKILELLDAYPIPKSQSRISAIDLKRARALYKKLEKNQVVGLDHLHRYDPKGDIGFCFGRAMAAHLFALVEGIHADSILKLFAVGSFKSGKDLWRYHVTTLVRSSDGSWWAIDPIFGEPTLVSNWVADMSRHDIHGDMNLYVTEAKRFSVADSNPYRREVLDQSYANGYFNDLLSFFRNESKEKKIDRELKRKFKDPS